MEQKAVLFQGLLDGTLQLIAAENLLQQRLLEPADRSLAPGFGLVQGDIQALQKIDQGRPVPGVRGDADAARRLVGDIADLKGTFQHLENRGDRLVHVCLAGMRIEQEKRVAAPGEQGGEGETRRQAPGYFLEEQVPRLVPEQVVDGFEIVDVQGIDGKRRRGVQQKLDLVFKDAPVLQAGQPVPVGQDADLLLLFLFAGEVDAERNDYRLAPQRLFHERFVPEDMKRGAVFMAHEIFQVCDGTVLPQMADPPGQVFSFVFRQQPVGPFRVHDLFGRVAEALLERVVDIAHHTRFVPDHDDRVAVAVDLLDEMVLDGQRVERLAKGRVLLPQFLVLAADVIGIGGQFAVGRENGPGQSRDTAVVLFDLQIEQERRQSDKNSAFDGLEAHIDGVVDVQQVDQVV